MREDAVRRGVPAPDERTVKECCLGKGVEVPDIDVLKGWPLLVKIDFALRCCGRIYTQELMTARGMV